MDEALIEHLLDEIEQNLTVLEASLPPRERLVSDRAALWLVLHGLQTSIQMVLDIAAHICASRGLTWDEYRELPRRLQELSILPDDVADTVEAMARFRNLIVHAYGRVDPSLVHEFATGRLGDFRAFSACVQSWLLRQAGGS